ASTAALCASGSAGNPVFSALIRSPRPLRAVGDGPSPEDATCLLSRKAWNDSGGQNMGRLEGKVALVTGSGRNIGRATVLKLAGEGANIVVNARSNQQEAESVAREVRDLGVKALAVIADVGNKAEVEALAS